MLEDMVDMTPKEAERAWDQLNEDFGVHYERSSEILTEYIGYSFTFGK